MRPELLCGRRGHRADVKAKYENGILELSIPKKEPQKVDNKKYIAIEG